MSDLLPCDADLIARAEKETSGPIVPQLRERVRVLSQVVRKASELMPCANDDCGCHGAISELDHILGAALEVGESKK